ncbi:tetratricopeptide repeat protein [Saprospiraceae bacterium]|nr:tetratricopeptide repeat protein [Saprospiraceae bacterium]
MKLLYTIIITLLPMLLVAQLDSEQLFEQANKYYSQSEYGKAAADYQQLVGQGLESSELYYNLGNAEYNLGHIGPAILYYEKAKLLSPNNTSINKNLSIARDKVQSDILEIPDFLPVRLWKGMAKSLSPTMWIAVQSLVGILLLYAIFLFYNRSGSTRRIKIIGLIVLAIVLLIISYAAGKTSHNLIHLHNHGIVSNVSMMYSAPDSRSDEIELLTEGVKVKITDHIDEWLKVELMNKNVGWIEQKTLQRI